MAPSRRTVLSTAAAGLVTAAAASTSIRLARRSRSAPGMAAPIPARATSDRAQNPDILVPPPTDHGTLPNLQFPFSASHMRLELGGWTRQVTERELGISKDIAGVNMRLNAGGVRELHWHKAAEWAYMLDGRRASPPSTRRAATSSTTSVSATSGTSRRAFRTRSRGSIRTAANSCWCSTTAASPKTTPS